MNKCIQYIIIDAMARLRSYGKPYFISNDDLKEKYGVEDIGFLIKPLEECLVKMKHVDIEVVVVYKCEYDAGTSGLLLRYKKDSKRPLEQVIEECIINDVTKKINTGRFLDYSIYKEDYHYVSIVDLLNDLRVELSHKGEDRFEPYLPPYYSNLNSGKSSIPIKFRYIKDLDTLYKPTNRVKKIYVADIMLNNLGIVMGEETTIELKQLVLYSLFSLRLIDNITYREYEDLLRLFTTNEFIEEIVCRKTGKHLGSLGLEVVSTNERTEDYINTLMKREIKLC